jgi:hypothetical protein
MDAPSFRSVTDDAFVAFTAELDQGPWGTIDITPYIDAEGAVTKPVGNAPAGVYFKIELNGSIAALVRARSGTYSAADLDRIWDTQQRTLNLALVAASADPDANKRAAAKRLRKVLLLGSGTGQTKLPYQKEVDFGRQQKKDVASGQGADDVKLLGLGPVLGTIDVATENLAAAINHGSTGEAPSDQARVAKAACAAAFSWVAEGLGRVVMRGMPGPDRETAEQLLEVLFALAARYPAPPPKPKKAPEGPTGATGATGATAAAGANTSATPPIGGATGPTGPTGP